MRHCYVSYLQNKILHQQGFVTILFCKYLTINNPMLLQNRLNHAL